MKRRVIASLLTLVLCLTLLPAPAFAEDTGEETPEPAATDIYVHSEGDDTSGDGSQENPYATLSKAVDVAPSGATIYVMSDLTMIECARFYNKNLTITSYGDTRTVTRGDGFGTLSDTARSWYNPAMIEVQGNQEGAECGLTLTNIILDDDGKHEGTVFAQAISGKSEEDKDNLVYVQDAMIASNATVPCTITLGEGAILRNFGGMSAVRVTASAELVMESGSVIEDTKENFKRTKGKETDEVGPAGAVWLQGAIFEMEDGAVIRNINGRAVYVDGGEATIGGTISNITGNANMWQKTNGTVIHLRNNASSKLTSTALIEKVSGGGSAVYTNGCNLTAENGSSIKELSQTMGIQVEGECEVYFDGEITGMTGTSNALNLQNAAFHVTLGKNSNIHDNHVGYGTVYIQAQNGILDIYGKINNNIASDRGGAIAMGNNFQYPTIVTMYDGAEICNNYSAQTGGGVMVSVGTFTMKGGTISNNLAKMMGGGVYVRRGGNFIMEGGTIVENTTAEYGGGIAYEAGNYNNGIPCVTLNGGTITGNTMSATIEKDSETEKMVASGGVSNDISVLNKDNVFSHVNRYFYISDDATIGNKAVYFQTNTKTVTPADDSLDIKLGNAQTASVNALTSASGAKGWDKPLATFWVQREGAVDLTVGGLNPDNALPVYVLALPVDETGSVPDGTAAQVYAAQKANDGNISLKLPNVSGNGYAVAIVQPTQDFGTLTISGPESIKQNKTDEDYPVTYTVTYDMSESLSSMIAQAGGDAEYSLAITADTRLTGTPGSFDGKSIQVTYTLPNSAFAVGDSLFASAELTVTVVQGRYVIPSNVTETKLLGLESFHVVFDWNDGSGKTETVSVTEGESLGDAMIADPTRSGYTFTGWNNQQDGKGSSFDNSTVITGTLTVYAQWSENSSGGSGSSTYYYFAIEKVDAQDDSALSGAKFGLFLDGKQIATATSNRSGIATFRVDESDYRKITTKSDLYYQELTAPEGYVVSSDKIDIEKSDLTTSQTTAEKNAETVRNYRGSTPDLLNGDDHFAYVVGYQDGCVHPNALITRAETATIFFRLLKDDVRDGNLRTSNTFADVPNDYWANTAISTMAGLGIVQGRSSTAFDPNASITRAEFAAICARFDTGTSSGTQTFSDIKGHWAQSYIERSADLGWIKGFEDGTFRPDDCITRAQATTMINRVLNRIPEENSDLLPDMNVWPDCNPGDWFYLAVQEATNSHNYKHKAGNYETWTSMKQDPDWTRYEN